MAKAPKKTTDQIQAENTAKFLASKQEGKNADGSVGTDIAAKAAAEEKAAKAEAAAKAKAEKDAAKAAAKAEKDAANAAKAAERKAAADAKKAEREARLQALRDSGKKYVGSMLALADRVKSGAYVKSATGQLRSNDELAVALDGVGPTGVIQLGKHVLNLETNPYSQLNIGQQSMNLRNRMRGAIKKGTLTIDAIKAAIVELDIDATESIKAKAQAKADAKAKREAEAAAKKEAKAKADAEKAAKKEPATV